MSLFFTHKDTAAISLKFKIARNKAQFSLDIASKPPILSNGVYGELWNTVYHKAFVE